MRTARPLLAFVAVSAAILAAGEARAATWSFTKNSPAWAPHLVTTNTSGVDAMVFTVASTGVDTTVTKMAFMVVGSVKPGALDNYQVIYYPNGITSPGAVVGSATGAGWKMGPQSSIVTVPLSSPITVSALGFTGVFALRVNVSGAPAFFEPQLQTVSTSTAGVEKYVLATDDLPLNGDTFYVN